MNKMALVAQAQAAGPPASQATHIEQSRAVAQVQGALIVAQQRPRDTIYAAQRMREACAIKSLAERAFFKFPRGGSNVTGKSIHLATELARCWGNIDFGITELSRNDGKGESEMLAVAWDLETNTRVVNSFIVPHKRDKRGGAEALTDLRDIYENNANNAARRLRECIFRVLPTYFIEEAADICRKTLEDGGGKPLAERREDVLKAFASLGVSRAQIEKKVGVKADRMSAVDIANLGITYQSIKRGETTVSDEFEDDVASAVSADLKTAAKAQANGKAKPAAQVVTAQPAPSQAAATSPLEMKLSELAGLPLESVDAWWGSPDIQNLVDAWASKDYVTLKDAVDARLSAN